MSQLVTTKFFYRLVIKTTYTLSLSLGIAPGVYDRERNNFKVTVQYLIYSGIIHLIFLAIIAFTAPFVQHGNNYMSDKPILQMAHQVGVVARSLAMLVISYMVWIRRQNLLEVYEAYKRFVEKYASCQAMFEIYFEHDLYEEEKRRERLIIYKFVSLNMNSFLITGLFIQFENRRGAVYYIMLIVNLLQNCYLVVCTLQFVVLLSEIQKRFYFINKALNMMQFISFPACQSLKNYQLLYEMYVGSYHLSSECLETGSIITGFMLLKIFTSNILILYHGVLMLLNNLPNDKLSNTTGTICVVNFYWDCFLIVTAMDRALKACNNTGAVLRGCGLKANEIHDIGIYKDIGRLRLNGKDLVLKWLSNMPLQIHVRLYKCIVKITYYYSFVLGIVPGPYKHAEQQFHITIWYLVYSALVQLCFLAITPFTLTAMQKKDTYMSNKPILLYCYIVGKSARILTIVVISCQIWLRRHSCLILCEAFKRFLMKYESYCEFMSLFIGKDVKIEQKRIQGLMICKFFSLHIHALAITLMYIQMQEQPERGYFVMICLNLLQGIYMQAATLQFMLTLSELSLKFFYINRSLAFLSYCRFPLKDMLKFYLIAYEMHAECLQITRNLLKACNSVTWFMLMKIFTTNIIILYHAVLVRMSSLPSHTVGNTVGVLCIINFYWDSWLVIQVIDNILTAGNIAAYILQDTWITLKEDDNKEEYKQIMQLLNEFSDYLACNKLEFCIFGLVKFDKATSFQYFVAALLHLIILVQFDLKKRLEVNNP